MNPNLNAILIRWGEWRASGVRGLGYPSMTPEARIRESPGRSDRRLYSPYYEPDKLAAQVDQIIIEMEPLYRIVLWCRYVQQMSEAKSAIATGCNGRSGYRKKLEKACREVAVSLGIKYK